MKSTAWIRELAFNLACCLGATVMCVLTMLAYRHLHIAGWLFLGANLSMVWYVGRSFQFRLQQAPVRPKGHAAI